jgi:hypothetical protein
MFQRQTYPHNVTSSFGLAANRAANGAEDYHMGGSARNPKVRLRPPAHGFADRGWV